tara:strand:+ start:282 stop:662 length:381 start_codon:yes stop_codon:yes gene_type:complete
MAAINKDTRLVMTILFVGAVSGMNVYFYANYGADLPWTKLSHAVLFSLLTIGGIMGIKAFFDLIMNDRMELWLLDRKIKTYWEKKAREEQQKQKVMESMRAQGYFNNGNYNNQGQEIGIEFLEQNM